MWASREWMYRRIDPHTTNISDEFIEGLQQFTDFAAAQPLAISSKGKIFCPCAKCQNLGRAKLIKVVQRHLLTEGFMTGYYVWTDHGEDYNATGVGTSSNYENVDFRTVNENVNEETYHYEGDNRYAGMVHDAFSGSVPLNNYHQYEHDQSGNDHVYQEPTGEAKDFYEMLVSANMPLYDGCQEGHSRLSLAARTMSIKTDHNESETCVDAWAQTFSEYLPQPNEAPTSYYETEKTVQKLGLPVKSYDVCEDNCMLFWREDKALENCKFCGKSRYQPTAVGRKKVPVSKMWYLPIGDRLKRMYQSEKTASAMRWHAEHESKEGTMCHPSDAAEWKNFDQLYPDFARETRNVRLGLCTDGFNPFGMHKNHSLWPVLVTPYNLPPDMCMNSEYLFLTILNSGPKHPRGSLDVFLQPLIEELKELWNNGVEAYDVSLKQNFNLKAVLLWTISDFPTYAMLSGWTTHGKLSCPICFDEINSFYLPGSKKTSWFDCHRRFLPHDHSLRRNRVNFRNGKNSVVNDYPAESLTGEQLYGYIKKSKAKKTSVCGGNGHEKKTRGYGDWHHWHKESIFWELPYWVDLTLRHCLDVMHIEKNFFDNIMYTVMNVTDKSKDTIKSRLDVLTFCTRVALHVDEFGNAPFPVWRLTKKAIDALLHWAKFDVRFPDGYVPDLATCADLNARKFAGMKSHDCHVFMERLLPFVFAELLPRNVHQALSSIGVFFRDLSSRTLEQSRLSLMKDNIVMILCNLEKIFPPSFFDVMEHLPIHLPYEAQLGGPVQYRWMYPFERYFKHLKETATNKRYPAACIVKAYMRSEISNFTSHYFPPKVSTTQKRRGNRFEEGQVPIYSAPVPDIFTEVGRASGKCHEFWLEPEDYKSAHSYVLRNCPYLRPMESNVDEQIRNCYPHLSDEEVISKRDEEFHIWVPKIVQAIRREQYFPEWVVDVVEGPERKVKSWPMYFTRGYMFHTRAHGENNKTMNYGVCVRGQNYSDTSIEDDFYGTIESIIELTYQGVINLKIVLFYCNWYDPTPDKRTRVSAVGVVDVLSSRKHPKYEPFILASQADQVCYLPYPVVKRSRKVWLSVLKINPRNRVEGSFVDKGPVTMQQSVVQGITQSVEEIEVESLADGRNPIERIDFEIDDEDPEDEFQCNLSDSEDGYEDDVENDNAPNSNIQYNAMRIVEDDDLDEDEF